MIVAYFSDFTDSLIQEKCRVAAVREKTGADRLVAIMSGNYLQNGLPAVKPIGERAKLAASLGIDLTLQMSLYASLSSIGIYAYSAARILDRLSCVDELVLETENASLEQLTEIAFVLISNTREFQQKVTRYKNEGMPFYEAQAKAIGGEVPDGEQIMRSWHNIFAVECIKALMMMYSSIVCKCIPQIEQTQPPCHVSDGLSRYLQYQICFNQQHLSDIYGGYETLTERILAHQNVYESFLQFTELIAGKSKDLYDVRKYFMRLLCGMLKSSVSIWRMYDFSPYCCVYAGDKQWMEEIREESKILLITGDTDQNIQLMNRSKQELWRFEKQAEALYQLQMKE